MGNIKLLSKKRFILTITTFIIFICLICVVSAKNNVSESINKPLGSPEPLGFNFKDNGDYKNYNDSNLKTKFLVASLNLTNDTFTFNECQTACYNELETGITKKFTVFILLTLIYTLFMGCGFGYIYLMEKNAESLLIVSVLGMIILSGYAIYMLI